MRAFPASSFPSPDEILRAILSFNVSRPGALTPGPFGGMSLPPPRKKDGGGDYSALGEFAGELAGEGIKWFQDWLKPKPTIDPWAQRPSDSDTSWRNISWMESGLGSSPRSSLIPPMIGDF